MTASRVDDRQWLRLEAPSDAGAARRVATELIRPWGYSGPRTAEVAIAVTELATNALLHATAASMLLRLRRHGATPWLEVVVIDSGPGIDDLEAAFDDGRSSAGTLGIGLGAIRRIANHLDVYSVLGAGTVSVGVFCSDAELRIAVPLVDGLTRPMTGELVCGDAWAVRELDGGVALMLADGLGHGELAARASDAATDCFHAEPWRGPSAFLELAHTRLSATRGAAVLSLELSHRDRVLRFAGIGNVTGKVCGLDRSSTLSSQPGIVGHQMRRVREVQLSVASNSVIVVHSDGLTPKWDLDRFRGLAMRSPAVISAVLLREAGLRQDDASIVVCRAD